MSFSRTAIRRLSPAADAPMWKGERVTRPFIAHDRWPSRARREPRAADLVSFLNGLLADAFAQVIETDDLLRSCEYATSLPPSQVQEPRLGPGSYCELVERMIGSLLSLSEYVSGDRTAGITYAPNRIEISLRPTSVALVWLDVNGGVERTDLYLPPRAEQQKQAAETRDVPCYAARTVRYDIRLLSLCAEILRDAQASISRPANAGTEAAALAGAAAAGQLANGKRELEGRQQPQPSQCVSDFPLPRLPADLPSSTRNGQGTTDGNDTGVSRTAPDRAPDRRARASAA